MIIRSDLQNIYARALTIMYAMAGEQIVVVRGSSI